MSDLNHFDPDGNPHMVDVGAKPMTDRTAIASGIVSMKPSTLQLIRDRQIGKGDVLQVARLAGIMASKRTPDLIPLCHPIRLNSAELEFEFVGDETLRAIATCRATDRTGVEMEAMTSVAVALLTVYDMCKSVDRGMVVSEVCLEQKSGGKSGEFRRSAGDV